MVGLIELVLVGAGAYYFLKTRGNNVVDVLPTNQVPPSGNPVFIPPSTPNEIAGKSYLESPNRERLSDGTLVPVFDRAIDFETFSPPRFDRLKPGYGIQKPGYDRLKPGYDKLVTGQPVLIADPINSIPIQIQPERPPRPTYTIPGLAI